MASKARVHCMVCDEPLPILYGDALGFDTEWLICKSCEPVTRKPRITLYGSPDGQNMGKWVSVDVD